MARSDFFAGLGFMILAVAVYVLSLGMTEMPIGIGPGDYPRVIAIGLFILGAILTFQSWKKGAPSKVLYPPGALMRVAVFVILTFVYIQLLPILGFQWITPVYLAVSMYHFGLRSIKTMVLSSLGVTWAIYLVFNGAFHVILPKFTLF